MNNELRIDKILDYYEEPQLFIARDMFDAQYICLLYDDDEAPRYTAVKISNAKLTDFLTGKVDLRQLFVSPEMKEEYYEVVDSGGHLCITPFEGNTLPEERLPERGYTLLDANAQESITVHLPIKDHGLFTELVRKFGWACM
ncbi:MAG: hypothetical protein LKE47_10880 [Prevotella sp.]|jgi:hypothetical protein|nr:hypothetical protein [Prevotella sp.]